MFRRLEDSQSAEHVLVKKNDKNAFHAIVDKGLYNLVTFQALSDFEEERTLRFA